MAEWGKIEGFMSYFSWQVESTFFVIRVDVLETKRIYIRPSTVTDE